MKDSFGNEYVKIAKRIKLQSLSPPTFVIQTESTAVGMITFVWISITAVDSY